jgi:hypothetical protein
LGVPTVADRIAQTVVAVELERRAEPGFHPDSYGYRPGRSALDAVAACRSRCWKTDWVIDLDIRKFFDNVPWDLVVKAVEANTDLPWVVLYVRRWLQAPLMLPDGSLQARDRETPQGSRGLARARELIPAAISPKYPFSEPNRMPGGTIEGLSAQISEGKRCVHRCPTTSYPWCRRSSWSATTSRTAGQWPTSSFSTSSA